MTADRGGQYVYTQLRSQGLGYRKTNLLYDYRKFQAVDLSKTPEARTKAESWFEKVYEPFRKEQRLTAKQASAALRDIKERTTETLEIAKLAGRYAEMYEGAFEY